MERPRREKRVQDDAGAARIRQFVRSGLSGRERRFGSARSPEHGSSLLVVAVGMALLLLAGMLVVHSIARPARTTSFVVVVLDTVRADHCTPYGYAKATTPRLAALAAEGLLFEHARAVAPWTLPSHASIFTGRLPSGHGCTWEHRWLAESNETIAEMLAARGFETFAVTTNPNASSLFNLDHGFETFVETWRAGDRPRGLSDSAYANQRVSEWLSGRDLRRPFFLFVNYSDAHLPYAPLPPDDSRFGSAGERQRRLAARGDLLAATFLGEERIEAADAAGLAALYDGDVHAADTRLGELLDLLSEHDLDEDTVVIVTSDHGEHLGEGGRVDHQLSLSEALLRVPLVLRFPRAVRPAVVREPVDLTAIHGWIEQISAGRMPAFSPPPDRAPLLFAAEYARPRELVELLASAGRDTAAIDRSLRAAYRPDAEGGVKLVIAEDDRSVWRVDHAGHESEWSGEAARTAAAELEELLVAQLSIDPWRESPSDLDPTGDRGGDGLEELARLGYAQASRERMAGVHASEHWLAGRSAFARGQSDRACAELRAAVRLAPETVELRFELAQAFDRSGDPGLRAALATFLRMAAGTPAEGSASADWARARLGALPDAAQPVSEDEAEREE
jgi:hypothetical protein